MRPALPAGAKRVRARRSLFTGGFSLLVALAAPTGTPVLTGDGPWPLPAAAAAAAAADDGLPLGLSHLFLHWDEVAPLEPSWVRINLHWGYFQPTPEADSSRWSWHNDETVQMEDLLSRGYRALAVIRTGSVWANRGTASVPYAGPSYPPADLAAVPDPETAYSASYYRFIHALVRHYNGDGVQRLPILVIENEVASSTWWQGLAEGESDAEVADEYLRLLATAYAAAKAADPEVKVADSGIASLAWGASLVQELIGDAAPPDSILAFANLYFARGFNIPWGFPYRWSTYDALREDFQVNWAALIDETYTRVTTILAGLRPSDRWDLAAANVDLVNLHFYENHWVLAPILRWMEEKLGSPLPPVLSSELGSRSADGSAAAPPAAPPAACHPPAWVSPAALSAAGAGDGSPGPPADWRPYYQAYGPCGFDDSDGPANELIAKIVVALAAGIAPLNWFILDGTGERTSSDKLALVLFDPDAELGRPVLHHRPAYYAYGFVVRQLARGGGHRRAVRDTCVAPAVARYLFADEASGARDLEAIWWDDGSGQALGVAPRGGSRILLFPPSGATGARIYRDYLQPEKSERRPLSAGESLLVEVNEHPFFLLWEGDLAPGGAWEISCGKAVGPGPPGPTGDYGWQGLHVWPNPFRDETRACFHLAWRAHIRASVHDATGRERIVLHDGMLPPGWQALVWNGRSADGTRLSPGVYFLSMEAGQWPSGTCGPAGPQGRSVTKVVIAR